MNSWQTVLASRFDDAWPVSSIIADAPGMPITNLNHLYLYSFYSYDQYS